MGLVYEFQDKPGGFRFGAVTVCVEITRKCVCERALAHPGPVPVVVCICTHTRTHPLVFCGGGKVMPILVSEKGRSWWAAHPTSLLCAGCGSFCVPTRPPGALSTALLVLIPLTTKRYWHVWCYRVLFGATSQGPEPITAPKWLISLGGGGSISI